jgi:hypothetical protein
MSDAPEHRPAESASADAPEEQRVADQIVAERPVPRGDFRGALGRYLAAHDPGYGPRPVRLRALAAVWIVGGVLLIALGLLQASGSL